MQALSYICAFLLLIFVLNHLAITQEYFGKTTYLLLSKITALITIILNNITIFAKKHEL